MAANIPKYLLSFTFQQTTTCNIYITLCVKTELGDEQNKRLSKRDRYELNTKLVFIHFFSMKTKLYILFKLLSLILSHLAGDIIFKFQALQQQKS